MDFRDIQETQRINKIKENNDCLTCEIVITKEFKEPPIAIIRGYGGTIGMAQMAKCLIDIAEQIKQQFPETKRIIPILNEYQGMKTVYKKVESWREF